MSKFKNDRNMKTTKLVITVISLSMICCSLHAQINRINRAVQRGVENAVEKKAEEKAEESASNAIDKAFEKAEAERARGEAEAERGLNIAIEKIEEAQRNQEEADALAASMHREIPEVGNNPYTPANNESVFFPMKLGSVQHYVSKDAKGKVVSQSRNTIKSITGDKNAFAVYYQTEILNDKGNPANKDNPQHLNFKVVVKDGVMYLDMKEMFGTIDGLNDVEATGTAMKIPTNLAVGQVLENTSARVKIGFLSCTVIMTDIKCVAIEDVKVEAGTFKCHKITQKSNSTIMGIKSEGTVHTWYSKGVGAVKTETYDKNGNLVSVQELKSFN